MRRPAWMTTCALMLALSATMVACSSTSAPSRAPDSNAGGPRPPRQESSAADVSGETLEIEALLLLLADRRVFEPMTLQRGSTGDATLRAATAVALGRIGDPRGRRMLEARLADDRPEVRRAAAFALGRMGSPQQTTSLLRAAADPDRETGRLAVEALGRLGAALGPVTVALAALSEEELWQRLLPSLYLFTAPSRRQLALLGLEHEGDLRLAAAFALTSNPTREEVPTLRRLLTDREPQIRAWAAGALGSVGGANDLPFLLPLLDDAAEAPVIAALLAASRLLSGGDWAPPDAWRRPLLTGTADPRPTVRAVSIGTSSLWLLDEELGDRLAALASVTAPESRRDRELALLALARGQDPRAGELVAAAALGHDTSLRVYAALAAGALSSEGVLSKLATDPEPRVRMAVLEARLGPPDRPRVQEGEARELVAQALGDASASVRGQAYEWLAENPIVALEVLARGLEPGQAFVESRVEACRAFEARALAESLERGALVALLETQAEDSSRLVRRAAARALVTLDRPKPPLGEAGTRRKVEIYRQVLRQTRAPRWVEISTPHGAIEVRLECRDAPLTCVNFLQLTGQRFYDGLLLYRLDPGRRLLGGDPSNDGWGGPGYFIRDEMTRLRFDRPGILGMDSREADGAGSRFFLTVGPAPDLDGRFVAFGTVTAGLDVLRAIAQGDPTLRIETSR